MKEIFWLEKNKICGRCGPRMIPWNLQELWDNGLRSILCVGDETLTPEEVKQYGFSHLIERLPANAPPNYNDEGICNQYLSNIYIFLEEQVLNKRTTLIHCHAGKDRTCLTMIHFLVNQGITYQKALDKVRSLRNEALSAPGWEEMARRMFNAEPNHK